MVFHLGALWRLNELSYLPKLDRISSVSGGSITAVTLALRWAHLDFDENGVSRRFVEEVVTPVRRLASVTVDVPAVLLGLLPGRSAAGEVARYYRKFLFGDASLQDLPDTPRFVINASNLQSTVLWRFSKPYMRDYRVGEVKQPRVALADAVAASSAFPPFLSPMRLRLDPASFTPESGDDLQRPPFTNLAVLTDGGVYDNLGLETVYKRYQTVLISDGGQKIEAEESIRPNWYSQMRRVLDVVDNQVRSLRKRSVLDEFSTSARRHDQNHRPGTYWGIRTDIADYGLHDAMRCSIDQTSALAAAPTRLAAMNPALQEGLVNWGYAVCDAAMRRHVDGSLPPPVSFPYPVA
jgi:NTE family protein